MGSCQSSTRERTEQQGQKLAPDPPCAPSAAEALESSKNNTSSMSPMQRYELLGLGRGVDITKETPWLEKTAFQVRRVDEKDIVETDEGGLLRGYDELVSNNTTIHYEVRAGIKAPHTPLSIGLDTEYSRNYFSSRHVVGTRVKNRTISFCVDFDDVPKLGIKNVKEAKEDILEAKTQFDEESSDYNESEEESDTSPSPTQSPIQKATGHGFFNSESFEKRLCEWLVESLKYRGISLKENQTLRDRIYEDCKSADEDILGIENDIFHFLNHFGVTHYISSIELGGLEYRVITEREHEKNVTVGGEGSITHSYGGMESSARQTLKLKRKMKLSERKRIGKIENDQVFNDDEEVIGYKIHPISSLVKDPYLQQALRAGIEKYAEMKSTGGPYLITTCGDRTMYLAVDQKSKQLIATFNRDEAVEFSVKILNESSSHHELEFALTSTMTKRSTTKPYKDMASSKGCTLLPLEYYMETRINPLTGKGSRPPRMWINPHYKNTRMILKKRTNHQISCDVKEWIKGRDAYYIRCIHHCNSGYLCVKKRKRNRQGNREAHEEQGIQQEYQQETSAPQDGQQVIRTPQHRQQVTPLPQDDQQVTRTPQERQQVTPTPQDGQQVTRTPPDRQQVTPTPQDRQQVTPTPPDRQQVTPTPQDGQQVTATPQDGQQVTTTPQDGQQVIPTPLDGQQVAPTPLDGQQVIHTPQDAQQVIRTPQDAQQVIRTPQDAQQVKRTPQNTRYKVCIKPSTESHCDSREVFMLFQLQPAK